MRPVHVLCSLVGFAVVCIACAGGVEPGVAEGPDAEIDATASEATGAAEQPETASLSIALRGMASRTPELIDANASGTYVALRIPTLRDADSDDIARCAYAGLADGVDGMELALVDFETQSVQQWTVYRTPTPDDSSCTNEADAVAELTLAKEAMAAAGLDSTQRGAWFMPGPFTAVRSLDDENA